MNHNWLTRFVTLLILGGMIASGVISVPAQASPHPEDIEATTRTGAWLDTVTFSKIDQADLAITQLQADQLDVYNYALKDPDLYHTVQADPNLDYSESTGIYTELTINPYGPLFYDGRLNPFNNPKIREAMNRLIDREHIIQEIYGGLGVPQFTTLQPISADYTRHFNTVKDLESLYAFNPSQAQQAISVEMLNMGATLGGDGKWQFNGSPVVIIFIIRVEDERTQIGDYVSDQLEGIGFTVDRQYKTSAEASAIWNGSDPGEGLWHIYTAGWSTTAISRDNADNFGYFYTSLGSGAPRGRSALRDAAREAACRPEVNAGRPGHRAPPPAPSSASQCQREPEQRVRVQEQVHGMYSLQSARCSSSSDTMVSMPWHRPSTGCGFSERSADNCATGRLFSVMTTSSPGDNWWINSGRRA